MFLKKVSRNKRDEPHENVERWMVSYADFVTLLFCFFTAMYAISNVDSNKLGKFVGSMKTAFHAPGEQGNVMSLIEGVDVYVRDDIELESDVRDMLGPLITESNGSVDVKRDARGVVISVADTFFFQAGSATLKGKSQDTLDRIAPVFERHSNAVRIEGHTDNVTISHERFPSNWELSSARAINVARYFIEVHDVMPGMIATTGYAEYKPVASNDTPEGRAKNRRVDIVLMSELEDRKEPK